MSNTQTVADTILAQLGGPVFIAMTGAKNLLRWDGDATTAPYLQFKVGRNDNRVTHVRVTLDPSDTYIVETFRVGRRGATCDELDRVDGVYVDMLRPTFERLTGLYTRL